MLIAVECEASRLRARAVAVRMDFAVGSASAPSAARGRPCNGFVPDDRFGHLAYLRLWLNAAGTDLTWPALVVDAKIGVR